MCLLEGVGGQLEAATGGSSQLPTCRVRPTAHLVASTIGPAATGPGPIQTQEVASIRLAAMNSFLIGQAAAVTRQSPRSTVMVSSPLQQPNSSMAPDSNHSHVIGRKVIVRIINSSDHDHDEVESCSANPESDLIQFLDNLMLSAFIVCALSIGSLAVLNFSNWEMSGNGDGKVLHEGILRIHRALGVPPEVSASVRHHTPPRFPSHLIYLSCLKCLSMSNK